MFKKGFYFDADKGGSGSGTDQTVQTTTNTQTVTPPDAEKKFTQQDLDRIVQERLQRAQETQKQKDEEIRRNAEAEAAKKQGEWQKVAEQREAELKTLTAQAFEKDIKLMAVQKGIKDPDYAVYLVTKAGEGANANQILDEYVKANPVVNATSQTTTNATNPATSNQMFTRTQLKDPTFYAANKDAIMQAAKEGRIKDE